jgi:hypothetical protein
VGLGDRLKFWKRDDFSTDFGKEPSAQARSDPLLSQGLSPGDPFPLSSPSGAADPSHPSLAPFPHDAMQGTMQGMPNSDPMGAYPAASAQQYPAPQPFPGSGQYPGDAGHDAGMQDTGHMQSHDASHDSGIHPRDIELILAKLDAIKSELDALHQRVRAIEQTTAPSANAGPGAQKRYW